MALFLIGEGTIADEALGIDAETAAKLARGGKEINRKNTEEQHNLLELSARRSRRPGYRNHEKQLVEADRLYYETGTTFTQDVKSGFLDGDGALYAWQSRNLPPAQNVGNHMRRGMLTVQVSVISTLVFFFMLMLSAELDSSKTENWYRTFAWIWILDFFEFCMLLIWTVDTGYNNGRGAVVSKHDSTGFHVRKGRSQKQGVDDIIHPEWNTQGRTERSVKLATGWIVLGCAITSQVLICLDLQGDANIQGGAVVTPLILGGVAAFALMCYLVILRGKSLRELDKIEMELAKEVAYRLPYDKRMRRGDTKNLYKTWKVFCKYQQDAQRAFWLTLGLLVLSVLVIAFMSLLANKLAVHDGSVSHGIGNYYLVFIPVWVAVVLATILWFVVSIVPWWVPIMDCGALILYFLTLAGVAATTILLPLRLESDIRMSWILVLLPVLLSLAILMLATCGFLLCKDLLQVPEAHWHTLDDPKYARHVLNEKMTINDMGSTTSLPIIEEPLEEDEDGYVEHASVFSKDIVSHSKPNPESKLALRYGGGTKPTPTSQTTKKSALQEQKELLEQEENIKACQLRVEDNLHSISYADHEYFGSLPLRVIES